MAFKEKQELLISKKIAATISFRVVLINGHKPKINWGWVELTTSLIVLETRKLTPQSLISEEIKV